MKERFESLFRLEQGQYTAGAPVVLSAGALLRDSYSDNLLCQLKFVNISSRTVKAIQVAVTMRDVNAQPLGDPVPYRYGDLMVRRDEEYGQRCAIVLTNAETRSFSAQITEVAFLDGGIWRPGHMPWVKLKKPLLLEEAYGAELAEQFRLCYGSDCRYEAVSDGELWFCTCGVYNHVDETKCHRCRRPRSALKGINLSALQREQASAASGVAAREEKEKEEETVRRRRLLRVSLISVSALLLCLLLLALIPRAAQRSRQYELASTLAESGRLDEAEEIFSSLGGYRDSAERAGKEIPYLRAKLLMQRAALNDGTALPLIGLAYSDLDEDTSAGMALYAAAEELFRSLGDYSDAPGQADACREALERCRVERKQESYDEAARLLEDGAYSLARERFLKLGDFSDSAERARDCVYRKAARLMRLIVDYGMYEVYGEISMDSDGTSVFSLSKERALELGSQSLGDLREACGQDFVDIRLEDTPGDGLGLLYDSVRALLEELGDYADSAELAALALPEPEPEPVENPTGPFFELLKEGELAAAGDWLDAYEGEVEYREEWKRLIGLYLPFCGDWVVYSGDPTLLPLTMGYSEGCYRFRAKVRLEDSRAWLNLVGQDGSAFTVELSAELGAISFQLPASNGHYLAAISNAGRLCYMRYGDNGKQQGGCEYSPAG